MYMYCIIYHVIYYILYHIMLVHIILYDCCACLRFLIFSTPHLQCFPRSQSPSIPKGHFVLSIIASDSLVIR